MVTLKVRLLLVTLCISYCSGENNRPCKPTVRDESFKQFMESRNCEVDGKLLKLLSSEESLNNSILNNAYGNFMCIGFMDALTLVPDNICDAFDPLSEDKIPDDDFCSSTKISDLQRIINGSVLDDKSNIFIVSKFTVAYCKVVCGGDTNQLCWAFGIITKVVFKHLSTQVPTTVAPQPTPIEPEPVLPALAASQGDDVATNNDDSDYVDNENNDSNGGSYDKPENPAAKNLTDYFDKDKVDNNLDDNPDTKDNDDGDKGWNNDHTDRPENSNSTPSITEAVYYTHDTKDNDVEDNGKDSSEYGTDTEKQAPDEVVDYTDDNQIHPTDIVQVDNQTDTDQTANFDDQGLGDVYQDDHSDETYAPPTSSTTPLPTEDTTAYLSDDYDHDGYDHDYGYGHYDEGDGSGYQYFMAILLLIFLLVVAEYTAAHKV